MQDVTEIPRNVSLVVRGRRVHEGELERATDDVDHDVEVIEALVESLVEPPQCFDIGDVGHLRQHPDTKVGDIFLGNLQGGLVVVAECDMDAGSGQVERDRSAQPLCTTEYRRNLPLEMRPLVEDGHDPTSPCDISLPSC